MAAGKPVTGIIKLQIPAGSANPAPPVGPALGQQGVIITVYKDKTFTFITKSPPASSLLKKAAGIATASGEPNRNKVGKVTKKQVLEIAKTKMADLNAKSEEAACRIIAGTARSM